MSKLGKFKDVLKAATGIGKLVAPGLAGSILAEVHKSINDEKDPLNLKALEELARSDEEQTQAILALHERLKKLEAKK